MWWNIEMNENGERLDRERTPDNSISLIKTLRKLYILLSRGEMFSQYNKLADYVSKIISNFTKIEGCTAFNINEEILKEINQLTNELKNVTKEQPQLNINSIGEVGVIVGKILESLIFLDLFLNQARADSTSTSSLTTSLTRLDELLNYFSLSSLNADQEKYKYVSTILFPLIGITLKEIEKFKENSNSQSLKADNTLIKPMLSKIRDNLEAVTAACKGIEDDQKYLELRPLLNRLDY